MSSESAKPRLFGTFFFSFRSSSVTLTAVSAGHRSSASVHASFSTALHTVFAAVVLTILMLSVSGCSSSPKKEEPAREISSAASEYAVFGNKFYRQGNYRQAEEMYLYSLEYYKRIDNRSGMVRSYNSLGKTYLAENKPKEAKRLFDAALRVVTRIEEQGDGAAAERGKKGATSQNHVDLLKAETLNNLGELALFENDVDRAMQLFQRGIETISERKNPSELAILLHNRGSVYKQLGQYERAEEDLLAALDMNKKQDLYQEMASNYYMLSSSASRQGDFSRARKYGLKALELDKRTENSVGIAQDLIALGQIAEKEGRSDAAVVYYIRAYRIYESLQLENGVKKIVEYLRRTGAASKLEEETVDFDVEIDTSGPPLPEKRDNGAE